MVLTSPLSNGPLKLAVLHYLCHPKHGGTSFYRHRHTRFEFVDEARAQTYARAVAAELPILGATAATYICGDDARFERTCSFPAAFNRVLIYQSINLHSADIARRAHDHMGTASDPGKIAPGAAIANQSDMVAGIDHEKPKQAANGGDRKRSFQGRQLFEIENTRLVLAGIF